MSHTNFITMSPEIIEQIILFLFFDGTIIMPPCLFSEFPLFVFLFYDQVAVTLHMFLLS